MKLPNLVDPQQYSQSDESNQKHMIALILPAFREDGRRIIRTLKVAMEQAHDPTAIQIIVVHAGQCSYLQQVEDYVQHYPLSKIVEYQKGGGRGPTLHYGTQFVTNHVVWCTFLHSDTLLPNGWDVEIRKAWNTNVQQNHQHYLQATAFWFGHDLSPEGLQEGGRYPHGITAVWVLGNTRAYTSSLPYGDHVITMPITYYRYVGGFPAQPIMEDYEMMDYWRRRAAWLHRVGYGFHESITILPRTVRTGVRRWQKHGVVYVTLVNALIVYRYQRGWQPQDVYWYYYERPSSVVSKTTTTTLGSTGDDSGGSSTDRTTKSKTS
jgi:hypothetical protein